MIGISPFQSAVRPGNCRRLHIGRIGGERRNVGSGRSKVTPRQQPRMGREKGCGPDRAAGGAAIDDLRPSGVVAGAGRLDDGRQITSRVPFGMLP